MNASLQTSWRLASVLSARTLLSLLTAEAGAFKPTSPMTFARVFHTATLLHEPSGSN